MREGDVVVAAAAACQRVEVEVVAEVQWVQELKGAAVSLHRCHHRLERHFNLIRPCPTLHQCPPHWHWPIISLS